MNQFVICEINLANNYIYKWNIDQVGLSQPKVDFSNNLMVSMKLKEGNDFSFGDLNIKAVLKRSDGARLAIERLKQSRAKAQAIAASHSQSQIVDDHLSEFESTPEQDKLHALYFNSMKKVPASKRAQDFERGFTLINTPKSKAKQKEADDMAEFLKNAGPLALQINKMFDNIEKSTQDHDSSTFKASSINPYHQFSSVMDHQKGNNSDSFVVDRKTQKPRLGPLKGVHSIKPRQGAPAKRRDSIRLLSVPKSFNLNKSVGNNSSLPRIRK